MPNKLFIKLMMMTTSKNDAEALVALRKANKILADANVNWEELLDAAKPDQSFRVPPSKRRPEPSWEDTGEEIKTGGSGRRYSNEQEINILFERVFEKNLTEGFQAFVESVHLWWERRGFLTEGQYKAIKRAAEG